MSSINSVNFVFGQYYDSTNLNQNGYSLTTTTNVPDETILDIELNGVIYNSFIRNNQSFTTLPYYIFPTLNNNVEYFVKASINGSNVTYGSFIYNMNINENTQSIPNRPTIILPEAFSSNNFVTVINDSGAEYWEYSTNNGFTWYQSTGNGFTLSNGTYYAKGIRVRNVNDSGIVSTSAINNYTIRIFTIEIDPPIVVWPSSLPNNGSVSVTINNLATIWNYSTDNGITINTGIGNSFILSDGFYHANSIQVRNSDSAGNTSEAVTNPTNITIDTTFPGKPIVIWPASISKDGTVTITLGSEAVSWEYTLDNGVNWNIGNGLEFVLQEGTYNQNVLQVRNGDSAGNLTYSDVNDYAITIDHIAPIITLDGSSIIIHEKGFAYNDPGATATDNSNIDLTQNIVVINNVDINVPGFYQVIYDVSDNAGNQALRAIRNVRVIDTTIPVITLNGNSTINHEKDFIYIDPGATATDFSGVDLTENLKITHNIDINKLGSYQVFYDVSDNAGNQALQVIRIVDVIDTTIPVITLNGFSIVTHQKGNPYIDAGAIAFDFSNVNLTSQIVANNSVNENLEGTYQITYDVSDNVGNQALQVQRTVEVIDTTAPIIELIGDPIIIHERGEIYNDPGAIATDFSNIILTPNIIVNSNVNQNVIGSYTVTYDVSDNVGNNALQKIRIVNVIDTTGPTILLDGSAVITHERFTPYIDPGARAIDLSAIDVTNDLIVENNVNVNVVGSYEVKFNVTDACNNEAQEVIRIVNVVDTTKPLIILEGSSNILLEKGFQYVEPGYTATDFSGIDLTSNVIINTNLDINIIGSYDIFYDVTDQYGNAANQKIRVVNIVDSIPPEPPIVTWPNNISNFQPNILVNVTDSTWEYSIDNSVNWINGVDNSFVLQEGIYDVSHIQIRALDENNNYSLVVKNPYQIFVVITPPNSATIVWPTEITNNPIEIILDSSYLTWEYSINSGATWNDGSGNFLDLSSNTYAIGTIYIRIIDVVGNKSPIVANPILIVIDKLADTPLVLWPNGPTNDSRIYITPGSDNTTFQYSVNNGLLWYDTSNAYFNIPDGSYNVGMIQVRALDVIGNKSEILSNPTEIIIDASTGLPIVYWPNSPSNNGKIVVNISSDAISWEYSIDRGNSWIDGSSNYFVLVDGLYNVGDILVRNTDAIGNISSNVINPYEIIIDSIVDAPFVTWPTSPSNSGVVTVLMSSEGVTWEYRLNSSSDWIDGCGNTFILPEGTYPECTIQVRNSDASGNVSAITINPLEIIIDYEPNDNSGNNVDFTLSGLNGSLTTSQFDTSNLNIEDMAKYVHVMNVDMSRNKWNDIFYISPQGPAYLDTLSELADENTFLNETIKFMTIPSNFTDTIDNITENNLILETGTLTNDIGLYNISESCIKIWSKAIFGGIEFMDDVWSNRNTVKYEINNFLSTDTSGSFIDKLRMVINNANGTTNENTSRMNLTRQLMLQLHNKIYGTSASYRLTDVSNGIFTQSPVDISGNPWTSGDKYYPFKFIKGDTLNFGLTLKHPDVYISVLGNSFDSNSPPNVNIKVRITMV